MVEWHEAFDPAVEAAGEAGKLVLAFFHSPQ